ncbi:MAG: hypothetical protein FWE26_03330 [Coriobacteriia bacterium]|nr:hypothetical protein [Coriobacteriia bacterium]
MSTKKPNANPSPGLNIATLKKPFLISFTASFVAMVVFVLGFFIWQGGRIPFGGLLYFVALSFVICWIVSLPISVASIVLKRPVLIAFVVAYLVLAIFLFSRPIGFVELTIAFAISAVILLLVFVPIAKKKYSSEKSKEDIVAMLKDIDSD